MKRSHTILRLLAASVFVLVLSTVIHAQVYETWVAGDGNDANPCTRDLPCQTFAAAIVQTSAGGEINVGNSGDFGPAFIDKSITIDGRGAFAGIPQVTGFGVKIDDSASPTPGTALVTLRNISINGAGQTLGTVGVQLRSGKTLNIENCQIFNFSYAGVYVFQASGSNVNIKNTSIFNANSGVLVTVPTGYVTVSLNGCNIENNTSAGINVLSGGYGSVRDSTIQFNGSGVRLQGAAAINIVGSQINHNTTGLHLNSGMTATIASSTFLNNSTNFSNVNGSIQTFGNNQTSTNPIPGTVTNLALR